MAQESGQPNTPIQELEDQDLAYDIETLADALYEGRCQIEAMLNGEFVDEQSLIETREHLKTQEGNARALSDLVSPGDSDE